MLHKGNNMRIKSIKKTPRAHSTTGKQRKSPQQSSISENKTQQNQTEWTAKGGKKDRVATAHTEKVKGQWELGGSMKYNNRKKNF